ncbi:TetR/AcrR family transcriptional regulator [Antrihabitans sp. YC3-6]|uniref:TetR/AcrR family transcriptional regulator n=1 Tax=Antrihabitans stalagmiti TaxID=2799499 RepID=A0A934U414_9NOCA|nr:TetR/AcrR family transcriptional regulator [Antrihabitans stalagmiti]MBJ8339363.1 TetR/AcrR family transcriptional regulator [Antrihabitans stalagmiti]
MTSDAAPARKRGRPKATPEEVDARRQKLVDAAYTVFLDKGYHATSIADITAQAGLGFGTYYKAFGNKREILDPVIDFGVEKILGDILLDDVLPGAESLAVVEQQFRTIGLRIGDAFAARPRLAKFLALESNTIDDALTTRWYGLVDLAQSLVAGYLDRGVDAGVLRSNLDTTETAKAIVGIILMAVLQAARTEQHPIDADSYIDAATALIMTGTRGAQPNSA